MSNPNVNKVVSDQVHAALAMLEQTDEDAANLLRTLIRAYCLFDVDLWELREMLLRGEHRCKTLAAEFREGAIKVERVARDAEL